MKDDTDGRQMAFDLTIVCRVTDGEDAGETTGNVVTLTAPRMVCVPFGYISCQAAAPAHVIPFLDATTIALRRNAVHRVETAGIFTLQQHPKR